MERQIQKLMSNPLILVTNDDGIYSNGIYYLQEALSEVGETIVVAPDTEKSGVGHGITISDPIRINNFGNKDGFCGYAVSGTPADCIKIAFNVILKRKPDIVVSGINRGANIGLSVLYSGTVSAAAESVIQGVPAIAISSHSEDHEVFENVNSLSCGVPETAALMSSTFNCGTK